MWEQLERLFGGGFMPHGHCYLWTPTMVWSQVSANTLIGLAYLSISATLTVLVVRVRLPFSWVYIAFGTFILACGLTHFFDVITVWHPIYWADAGVRMVTAVASVGTAVLVFPLVPKVIALAEVSELAKARGEQLRRAVDDLTVANEQISGGQKAREELAAENARLSEHARVQEFQERFLAVLGHDLRNPLAAIDMGTAILKRSAGEREQLVLRRMESSSLRMSRMIEQILDLTRSRLAGGLEMHPRKVDLPEILGQVIEELRIANPQCTIELTCPAVVSGEWDPDRLSQVFSNLVSNALQHGYDQAPVRVDVRAEGEQVSVSVHNEGPPIPEEMRAKLFDPFRRGTRDSRTSKTAGLGLGLFISWEIVAAHGGSIDVTSNTTEGTTFRLQLPRALEGAMEA